MPSSSIAHCDKNVAVRRSMAGEAGSRYRSPLPTPSARRASLDSTQSASRRSLSTPFKDTAAEILVEAQKEMGSSKIPESVRPSRMRSLVVAFQSDILSVPVRQASHATDRALRPAVYVAQRMSDTKQRVKATKSAHQSENSKPVESVKHFRSVKEGLNKKCGTVSSDNASKTSSLYRLGSNTPSPRRLSLGNGKVLSDEHSSSSDRIQLANAAIRALSMPDDASSPRVSRGISPLRSPARARRFSTPSRQAQTSTSVLRFFADIKKCNKAATHIEDVHHLRLLYNRHLQWRYANACNDSALRSQKLKAEKMLYSLWSTIMNMWDSVIEKRISFQQLNLMLMLHSVVNNQVTWLNKWAAIETDHANSLTWVIQNLRTSTICVPLTRGARGDIKTVKAAMRSAIDVLQEMGSTLYPILSRVESTSSLVSQLANVAARERAVINEFESLLSSAAALQVEEQSLRTHLLQMSKLIVKNH